MVNLPAASSAIGLTKPDAPALRIRASGGAIRTMLSLPLATRRMLSVRSFPALTCESSWTSGAFSDRSEGAGASQRGRSLNGSSRRIHRRPNASGTGAPSLRIDHQLFPLLASVTRSRTWW